MQPPGHMQNENTPRPSTSRRAGGSTAPAASGGRRRGRTGCVDQRLRVLDAHADRERLGLERARPARRAARTRRAPSGRSRARRARRASSRRPRAARRHARAGRLASTQQARSTRAPKRNVDADALEPLAQRGDHLAAACSSRCAGARRRGSSAGAPCSARISITSRTSPRLCDARVELAVAVRAGAALAEAVVAVGVDAPCAVERP